jgi:hypothetical protein
VAEFHLTRLTPEHRELLATFECTVSPAVEPVVSFLRNKALDEQSTNLSATFVMLAEKPRRIDAYITLSVAAWEIPSNYREKHGIGRRYVPALMLGYIGISDEARRAHPGLGLKIFERVKFEAFQMNAYAGVRLVTLEVEARNWRPYQIYSGSWGMYALSLDIEGKKMPAPDPKQGKPPTHIPPEYKIKMVYDLYETYGSYWPRPHGLPATRPFE